MSVVYVTGASAGLGRAIAEGFSAEGHAVGLIARDPQALERTAAELGGPAAWAAADVAVYSELEGAAATLKGQLGPPDIWVNDAMLTIFSRFIDIEPDELARVCNVTFLGSAYGLRIAMRLMEPRGRGHIIQVGSTLAYRPIPLQSAYCSSKLAIRGLIDSLRCELIHDRSPLRLTVAHMPGMNTPQFDWAGRHIAQRPQPMAPVYAPEACAKAVVWTSKHPGLREVWVGAPTVATILANRLAPGLMDRFMARSAYEGQFEAPAETADTEGNLFAPVSEPHRIKGRFRDEEKQKVFWIGTSARREVLLIAATILLLILILWAILD